MSSATPTSPEVAGAHTIPVEDIELGLDTFGDMTVDVNGNELSAAQVIRNLVDQAVLADQLGLDFIGVGEHHRDDFAVSAPEVVLAAIAGKTEQIHIGSAVTVLSSDDPIRVFQRFSTLDAVSNGRAEVILGRGSFTESFPLFGYDLSDYEVLFEEKLDIFSLLLEEKPFNWSGETRPPIHNQEVYPKTENGLKAWIAVGGSPNSVVRAARYRLPLMLAIIGGDHLRFAPFADLYRQANTELGNEQLPIGIHSPGHVGETDEEALEQLWPHYQKNHARIGAERGWPPMTRQQFEAAAGPNGALTVGSPQTVAAKIVRALDGLGATRFDLKYSSGPLPHEHMMSSIELYATEVAPLVRAQLRELHASRNGVVAASHS